MSSHAKPVVCDHEGCTASHPGHAWGHIKAEGWFHGRNGSAFCPEHLPDWVGPWRAAKARAGRGPASANTNTAQTGRGRSNG